MAKINIIKKSEEIEGELFDSKVTPFGTSAHIPFSKKYIGRNVKIIVPKIAEISWVLSEEERKDFIEACLKQLKRQPESRLTFHKRESINSIRKENFDIDNLQKALTVLKTSELKKDIELVEKIKRVYGV